MESDECRLARLITEAFIKDLLARKGLRQMMEEINPEIRREIEKGWYDKALEIIRKENGTAV